MQAILNNSLPQEIVSYIYAYTNFKLRNGIYMRQLDKNMEIFNLLTNIPKISNSYVELFIKFIKRKSWCEKKIKIQYKKNYNQLRIKFALDEIDWDGSRYEVTVYNIYWY
jgi:hypothetical protein